MPMTQCNEADTTISAATFVSSPSNDQRMHYVAAEQPTHMHHHHMQPQFVDETNAMDDIVVNVVEDTNNAFA